MRDYVVENLKACVMSRKGGIPIHKLNDDYKEIMGESIPYKLFGFKSLEKYLESIDGISIRGNNVRCVAGKKTLHLDSMINKQKSARRVRKRKVDNYKLLQSCSKKKKCSRDKSPPKIYHYDPKNCAFQKNIFLFNHLYDEYDCIFREDNLVYNLVYSLCQVLTQTNIKISSCLSSNTIGDTVWTNALKNRSPINYTLKSCFQDRSSKNVILYGHQIIGDDFMIQLTSKSFGFIPGGTCRHGLTLKEAQKEFLSNDCAKNVLITCGILDMHNGVLLEQVVKDMQNLILCVLLSGCKLVVCNIPPSPYSWLNHQISAFNYWLSTIKSIIIIDIYTPFIDEFSRVNYSYFSRYPVYIARSRIHLWSKFGQDIVMKTIYQNLTSINKA